jgi:hypothetical protein
MFDVLVDELRAHSTEWLESRRREVIGAQRELRAEELAILRVLDERGRIDPSMGSAGESARVVRDKLETARALEALPAIASVALEGGLSDEQLSSVVKVADEGSDAEWARRAPNCDPLDIAREARKANKPSPEESRARHAARELRMWWTPDRGMLHVRGQLPDEMGERFESTIHQLTEKMRPPKGQAWDSLDHRSADALLQLCEAPEPNDGDVATLAPRPNIQVLLGLEGPATIAGIPIADSLLEQIRANATIEPILVDGDGTPIVVWKRIPIMSQKIRRAVLLRDGKCRVPGCSRRKGLQVHHLEPESWGGSADIANLAAVCPAHHRLLIPHGLLALVGNPNLPDGLELGTASRGPPLVPV